MGWAGGSQARDRTWHVCVCVPQMSTLFRKVATFFLSFPLCLGPGVFLDRELAMVGVALTLSSWVGPGTAPGSCQPAGQ